MICHQSPLAEVCCAFGESSLSSFPLFSSIKKCNRLVCDCATLHDRCPLTSRVDRNYEEVHAVHNSGGR